MSLVTVNKRLLVTCVQLTLSSKRCTSQFHLLLIVLMKETHLYDAFDPLLVERHIGVPPREPFPTSQTSCSTRTRADEITHVLEFYLTQFQWEFVCHQCLLLSVDPHCLLCRTQRKYPHHSWYPGKRQMNISSYRSTGENSTYLGTKEPIVEPRWETSAQLLLHNSPAWEGGDVGAELVVALLVGDDGHIGLQQRARGFVFCHPITLHLRHTPIEVLLSLVNAGGRVSKL